MTWWLAFCEDPTKCKVKLVNIGCSFWGVYGQTSLINRGAMWHKEQGTQLAANHNGGIGSSLPTGGTSNIISTDDK